MDKDAVIDAVRDFAESEGYNYEFNAEREFMRLGFKIDCKLKHVDIVVAFHDHGYNVFAISPITADADSIPEMMKYLSMANFGLVNGNFEINSGNGEIRYRCWVGIYMQCCAVIACSVAQSCLILCIPIDCSPPGSSKHGISQVRILEWVAIPFFRGSS